VTAGLKGPGATTISAASHAKQKGRRLPAKLAALGVLDHPVRTLR
jgi:hypothetical protein